MTAPSKVPGSPRNAIRPHEVLKARSVRARKFAISDGVPVEVLESGPSVAARVATLASRLTIRPVLAVGSYVPDLPWPWGLIDLASRVLLPVSATVRETVSLPNASIREWFNIAAFALPTGPLGDARRNSIIGPGTKVFDMAFTKIVPLKESRMLEFRAQATNIFNIPNYSSIDTNLSTSSLTFGRVTAVGAMRQFTMTARFRF